MAQAINQIAKKSLYKLGGAFKNIKIHVILTEKNKQTKVAILKTSICFVFV